MSEKRLIDANKALKKADEVTFMGFHAEERKQHFLDLVSVILEQPTVDAVEVVHGRWDIDEFGVFCTACKEYAEDDRRTTYCPECGAKMDGDGNG